MLQNRFWAPSWSKRPKMSILGTFLQKLVNTTKFSIRLSPSNLKNKQVVQKPRVSLDHKFNITLNLQRMYYQNMACKSSIYLLITMIWDDPFQALLSFSIIPYFCFAIYYKQCLQLFHIVWYHLIIYYVKILFECIHLACMYFMYLMDSEIKFVNQSINQSKEC